MKACLFAMFAVFCWSFNVVVASSLVSQLTPWQIAGFRWIIASAFIMLFCFSTLKKHLKVIWFYKKDLLWTALWGITISNTCVYYAAHTVQPVTLSLIGATGPLFLIFFAWLLKGTRLTKRQFFGLIITLVGVILIIIHGRNKTLGLTTIQTGDWWMLGTAITFGYYSYRVAHKPKELPFFPFLASCIIIGTILCLPFFIYDTWINPLHFQTNFTQKIIWIMLFMGIFNSLLAYLFWNKALEIGNPIRVAMIYYLMPVFSTLESSLILGDKVLPIHLIGAAIIFLGIYYSNTSKTKIKP